MPLSFRQFLISVVVLSASLTSPLLAQTQVHPRKPPLAILDFPNASGFAWVGNDKILVISRRQYRRGETQLIGLTSDLKPEYLSAPRELARFGFGLQNASISVSPDGRWVLGSDVRGPRVIDLTTGDAQGWPGDPRRGYWLPDGHGWVEAVHVLGPGDPSAQERVERELDSKTVELRLYEAFGDEWPNSPARKSQFNLPVDTVVVGALNKAEFLIASSRPPSSSDITLSRLSGPRPARVARLLSVKCPAGGEVADIALSPDRRSVAWLLVRPAPINRPSPGAARITLSGNSTEAFVAEVWTTPLNRPNPRLLFSRSAENVSARPGMDGFTESYGAPRSLQWRPDGKVLGYVANDQLILVEAALP